MSYGTAPSNVCPIHRMGFPCPACTTGPHMVEVPPSNWVKPATEAWEFSLIRIAMALEKLCEIFETPGQPTPSPEEE